MILTMGVFTFTFGTVHAETIAADSNRSSAFYVSNAGNDSWDGRSPEHRGGTSGPWKSLTKVNALMTALKGGRVLFRRGDQFAGRLKVQGQNITFADYGEGARPVLTGAHTLPGQWKPTTGRSNVYECELPQEIAEVTVLLRNGVSLPLGRTPNNRNSASPAFHTFVSRTVDSVTDPELADAEELVGAEIVLRKNNWTYHAYPVTAVTGNTVRFANEEPHTIKKGDENLEAAGYFFQKHLATLDTDGEWFFDPSEHRLFLHSKQPPRRQEIRYSAQAVVVDISGANGIELNHLQIEMAASLGVEISNSESIQVRDCEVRLCGREGLRLNSSSGRIEGNTIHDCLGSGVHAVDEGRVVVTRNTISNIGLIPGRGWTSKPLAARRNGIMLMGGNSEASYNRLKDIGYIGIQHVGGHNLVRRNFIERYNRVTFDGGAIYTYGDQTGSIVEENIILHGMANTSGLVDDKFFSTGIQCDAKTANLIIRDNTIAYPESTTYTGAIHLNFNGRDNTVSGNTILTRSTGISTLDRDPYERTREEPSPPSMSGNRFECNVIVRLTGNQPGGSSQWAAILMQDRQQCDLERQGVFRDNVCAVPFTGSNVIFESQRNCRDSGAMTSETWFATVAEWDQARSYASGNLGAPVHIAESKAPEGFVQLFYNDSDTVREFPLPSGPYMDPRGNPRSGIVTVNPWRSVVLFKVSKQEKRR